MGKKILIVDDEPDLVQVTAFRLKKAGYEVTAAMDGQEALDLAEKYRPDLILLDVRLPLIDGFDVCKKIKSDAKLKKIIIILFTANTRANIAEQMKEAGADGCMTKPFDGNELLEKIKQYL